MVVFYHLTDTALSDCPLISSRFVGNGYLMVDFFFVLSGFIIFHNYGRKIKSGRDVIRFIFLRFGRLYPLHLATLLLFVGIECFKYVGQIKYGMVPHNSQAFSTNNAPAFIANLLMVNPFFGFSNGTFNTPSWSIGTEFYTYMIFSVVILLAPNRKSMRFLATTLVIVTAVSQPCLFHVYYLSSAAFISFLRCIMGFFIGVLVYDCLLDNQWIRRWSNWICLALAALVAIMLCCKPIGSIWDYSLLPCYALLIVAVADSTSGMVANVLNFGVVRWLGRISYSIYLCHLFVIEIINRLFPPVERIVIKFMGTTVPPGTTDACLKLSFVFLTVLLVLLMSQLTYHWIEMPFHKKFRGWSKSLFPAAVNPATVES